MLRSESPKDRIIATGKTYSVRDLIVCASKILNIEWEAIVIEKPSILNRPSQNLCGCPERLINETGWRNTVTFEQLVKILVEAELEKNVCINSEI